MAPRAKKTDSAAAASVEVAAPAPVAAAAAPVEAVHDDAAHDSTSDSFKAMLDSLADMRIRIAALTLQVRNTQRRVDKEMKEAKKSNKKRARKVTDGAPRAPSGFVKPTAISAELAAFLGVDKSTLIARTEVTKRINAYVRENKLQDPENGRKILPDAKLRKLLKLKKEDELNFFNLQKHLTALFPKEEKPASA